MSGMASGFQQWCVGTGGFTPVYPTGNNFWATASGIPVGFTSPPPQLNLFLDEDLAVIVVKNKNDMDGCTCVKCNEYYQYAVSNQEDGTLICYGCRMRW